MVEATPFDCWVRGLYLLLEQVADNPARLHKVRQLQQRFTENLPAFHTPDPTPMEAAIRAEVLDALERVSHELTGRSFTEWGRLRAAPAHREAAWKGVPTPEEYARWLRALVVEDRCRRHEVCSGVEAYTLSLLPDLAPPLRAPFIQQLYDAGLIFNLEPRLSLAGAYLSRSDFVEALLVRAHLAGVNMRGAKLVSANIAWATLNHANLITARLGWAVLAHATMVQAELGGAVLMGTDLSAADMRGASLVKTTLRRASLEQANLSGANLLAAQLDEANLTGANLAGANLLWANFAYAHLDGVNLQGATYNDQTEWPTGFDPAAHGALHIS